MEDEFWLGGLINSFVTGGTAKSPVLNEFLQQPMPGIPVMVGDHLGRLSALS